MFWLDKIYIIVFLYVAILCLDGQIWVVISLSYLWQQHVLFKPKTLHYTNHEHITPVRNRELEMERCFNTNIGTFSVQNVNDVIHRYTLFASEKSVIIALSNGLALSVLETEMANL